MANGSIRIVIIETAMNTPLKPCSTYNNIDSEGNASGNTIDITITNAHMYIVNNLFILFPL